MKQTKQILRPLLMAIVMLVGMLMPQGAWAQELEVWEEEPISISSDASYDEIVVQPGGVLIINEGVTLTVTSSLYINENNINGFGTVINYGTIIGEGCINMMGGVLANHGHIDLSDGFGHGTFYNTGTLGDGDFNLTTTPCDHDYEDLGEVDATCTHGDGTQYRCKTCYYMRLDETSGALPHSFDSHNGMNICSSCGHTTYDAPDNGDGSEEDPYRIANAGNLYWFADYTRNENCNANAILTADIVLNDGTFDADGTFTATGADEPSKPFPWLRIGDADGRYFGTFDGNGHTISGMYVNGSFGLFHDLFGSVVNLGIVNCYIRDNSGTGAICYWNYGTISNCYTTGILSGSYSCGICDTNISGSTISNCYSTCTFVYDSYFDGSGICGTNLGTISNCYTSYDTAIQDNAETASEVYGGVSADRFASGEIAWLLNGSVDGEGNWTAGATDGTQAWYQKLGENGDSYPVLAAAEGNTVYYGYENCLSESKTYSNNLRYAEKEDAHDWEEYGEHVHKCNICELETVHDWSNGDSKCAVCEYVCQHKVEDDDMWENGECTICGYECQHEFEPVDDGYEEGFFIGHICSICDFEEEHDFSNEDGKCTACGYVCYHNEIDDCACTICGNARHEWWEGVCNNCHAECEHNKNVWLEEAQEATCVSQGKAVDYYQCECGLYFADEECTTQLSWDDVTIPATGHSIENGTCTACGATVTIAGTLSFEGENTVTFWNECYKLFEDPTAAPLYRFECDGNGNLTISSETELSNALLFIFDSNFHYMGTWEFMDIIWIENSGTYYLIPTYYEDEEDEKVEGQTITLSWEVETVCQHTDFESVDKWYHICKECDEYFPHSIAEEDGQCVCDFKCPGHEWGFDVNEIYAACQETPNTMIQHCDYCHYTKEEVVDPNGECPNGDSHDWYEDSYAATCVQHGYTKHWCEKCDARYLDNFSADIDPDVHDWEADQDSHWCCNGCEAHGSYEEHTMDENGKCTVCGYKECQHTDFESVNNWNHICKECGESFKHYIEEDGGECVCGFKCTKHRFYVNAIASVEETESKNDGKIYVVEECEYCQVQGEPKVVDTKSACSKSKNHNHFWVRYTTDVMPTTEEGGIAKISCWYCDESYGIRVPADPHACANYWGHEWEESEGNIVCIKEDCDQTITPAATLAMGENAGIDVDASVHHYYWDPSSAPLYKFVPENSGPYDFKIKGKASADCKVFIFETNEYDHLDMNIQDGDHYAFEAGKNYYLQFLTTDVDSDREPIAYKGATIVVSESTQLVIAAAADASGDSAPVVIAKDEQTGEWATTKNIVLTDGVESFSTPVDFKAPKVDYERLMPNSQWGTLCLPFDITVDAAGKPYDFYELTSATSTEVTLTKVADGILPANTPVIVRRNASETGVHFTENEVTVKTNRGTSDGKEKDGLQMIGVFMPYELYGGSYYLDAVDGKLYDTGAYYNETGNPVKVNAYRCYFDVVGGHDEARALNINFEEEEVSSIEAIDALTSGKAKFYDLQGRERSELQSGLNVLKYGNGKSVKVIIK